MCSMSYEEGNSDFVPLEGDSNLTPGAGESGAPANDPAADAQLNSAPAEVERRKKRVSLYWKRPKSHLYEYNYDYGANYYKVWIFISSLKYFPYSKKYLEGIYKAFIRHFATRVWLTTWMEDAAV